jgi:hypothetical protein
MPRDREEKNGDDTLPASLKVLAVIGAIAFFLLRFWVRGH